MSIPLRTGIRLTSKDQGLCREAMLGFEHFPLARSPLASHPFPFYSNSFLSGPVELVLQNFVVLVKRDLYTLCVVFFK